MDVQEVPLGTAYRYPWCACVGPLCNIVLHTGCAAVRLLTHPPHTGTAATRHVPRAPCNTACVPLGSSTCSARTSPSTILRHRPGHPLVVT